MLVTGIFFSTLKLHHSDAPTKVQRCETIGGRFRYRIHTPFHIIEPPEV
jgi:hypothetical protein